MTQERRKTAQLAEVTVDDILGEVDERLKDVNARRERARAAGWSVFPNDAIRSIPRGFRVVLTAVQIDPDPTKGDVYSSQGKLHLRRRALVRLAEAFGVDWDGERSGRIDDGRNPTRVEWRVVGRVLDLTTATWRDVVGSYEFDISARENETRSKWPANAKPEELTKREDDLRKEKASWMKFKLARAESGAFERAVAALGVERAYDLTSKDGKPLHPLSKPFLIARLQVDPAGDAEATKLLMTLALKGAGALYGSARPTPPPAMPAPEEEDSPALAAPSTGAVNPPGGSVAPVPPRRALSAPPPSAPVPPLPVPPEAEERVEFEALDQAAQVETLEHVMKRKGYELGKEHGAIASWSLNKRMRFYEHLKTMPDKTKGDDGIPF